MNAPGFETTSTENKGFKDSLRETKEKIRSGAQDAASQAKARGEEYVNETRQKAAERISRVSDRVKETADRFDQEHDADIAHYTRLLAGKLETAAAFVRERDFEQFRHEVEDTARRHPAMFFGGLFVAGIAAARFLKASSMRQEFSPGGENTENPAEAPFAGEPRSATQPMPS